MIKIILIEDHLVVRNGIKLLLESSEAFEVINEASNGVESLEILEQGILPDVVITDIDMPLMDGITLTGVLNKKYPAIKVIVLSMLHSTKQVIDAFNAGAKGYLLKNASYNELLFAVQHVAQGGRYVCGELSLLMIESLAVNAAQTYSHHVATHDLDLSDREVEVLQLISEGYTNLEIGDKLFLSKRTVEGHRQSLINKAQVKNSAELIKFAVQHQMVV